MLFNFTDVVLTWYRTMSGIHRFDVLVNASVFDLALTFLDD